MRICPSCKTQAAEGAKFCRKCGGTLVPEKAAAPQTVAKRQLLEARLKAEPQNADLLEEYSDLLLSVGLVEDALVQLHTVAEIGRGNEALLLKIAEAYRTIQQWDNAAAQIRRALEVSPDKPALYERLANVLLEGGRTEDAAQALLAKQAKLTLANVPILVRIRDLMREAGKHDDLVNVCRAILEKEPRELATWSILADTLLASNKRQEAVEAFRAILALNPDDPRASLYIGIAKHDAAIYSKEATLADATALLNKAVGGKSGLPEDEQNLALLYLTSAKLHSGAATFEIQLDLQDVDADKLAQKQLELLAACFLLFGDIAKNADRGDEAIRSYKKSLRLHDSPLVQKRLAEIYGQKGDQHLLHGKYRRARTEFKQALSYVSADPSLAAKRDEAALRQHRKNVLTLSVVVALFVVAGLAAGYGYWGLYLPAKRKAEAQVESQRQAEAKAEAQRLAKEKADALAAFTAVPAGTSRTIAGLGLDLVKVEPGTFLMGSPASDADQLSYEGPQTRVTISKGFWMGKYEVTQGQYAAVLGANPSWLKGSTKLPVERVSWVEATDFCAKLTEQERQTGRLPAGYVYRLPTAAEWEFACRAGTTTRFSFGEGLQDRELEKYGWYAGNSEKQTHPVGEKAPNAWGLYDMHGNVWEWCQDWDGPYPGGSVTDPQGPSSGSFRVFRGGGLANIAIYCQSAYRLGHVPDIRLGILGFRVVLAPGQ